MINNLVSIIITTCNRCEILPRAIESVMNQTYSNIEIIIVDDASIDNTEYIVRNFMNIDSRIKYIKNTIQSGANVSRNKGIQYAKGRFIAGLDDDDEFLPQRIELLINNYDDSFAFITSHNLLIEDGVEQLVKIPNIVSIEDMLTNNTLMNQALVEKSRFQEVGYYDIGFSACQDYDMWMRLMIRYGKVKVIDDITQIIHCASSINRISTNSKAKFKGYFKFYKRYKYLMNKFHRQQHLFRIYGIRVNMPYTHLPIKFLEKKLINSSIKQLSIYGSGVVFESLYPLIKSLGIKINYIIDSNIQFEPKTKYGINIVTLVQALEKGEDTFLIASAASYNEIQKLIQEKVKLYQINENINIISL